jgi:DNA topoisomerase-1
MAKNLIIVESPAKVKTIGKFLGKDYMVEASVGHVRDLPVRDLGVDEAQGFAPRYQVIKGKEEVVKRLKAAAKKAGHVFLAPDPDREGEAIAWHVAELIKDDNRNLSRIQFNEITPRAVREALEHPRPLNERLFDSQQARRVLDRLVGYKISPILWKKVKRGISAGRVQSVALKLIVEREKARRAFQPEEYWPFKALLAADAPPPFWTELWKLGGKSVKPGANPVGSQDQAEALHRALTKAAFVVDSVEEKKRKRSPLPPYITSTLQQDANNRLGYPAKKTMTIAQRLYEGVDLGERGTLALITYMRTDSVRVADEARDAARAHILERFGKEFLPAKPRAYKTKGSAQDAHEAIRPVDPALTPEELKPLLPADQYRIYALIWQRFTASQMADAEFWDTTVTVRADKTLWRAKGERLLFPGFLAAQGKAKAAEPTDSDAEAVVADLPKLVPGQTLEAREIKKEQKFTSPPPRYSEASLVKELEELGIGRPSTYAAIISTIQDREYVRLEEKRFAPSELGVTVSDQLCEHFPELMDVGFTADMENKLDAVSEGKQDWTALIRNFADGFYPLLEKAQKEMTRTSQATDIACELCGKPMAVKFGKTGEFLGCTGFPDCKNIKNFSRDGNGAIQVQQRAQDEPSGIDCELCGKPLVVKSGSRGPFLGCSGYPECKNIKNFTRDEQGVIQVQEQAAAQKVGSCPKCGKDLLLKTARTGSRFIACSGYPACDYTEPFRTGVKCPNPGCDGELVEKSSRRGKVFYSCTRYPKCDYATWDWPLAEACPECGHPVLVRKNTKAKGKIIACPKKGCSYSRPDEE